MTRDGGEKIIKISTLASRLTVIPKKFAMSILGFQVYDQGLVYHLQEMGIVEANFSGDSQIVKLVYGKRGTKYGNAKWCTGK